jgi:hypothetical protein
MINPPFFYDDACIEKSPGTITLENRKGQLSASLQSPQCISTYLR